MSKKARQTVKKFGKEAFINAAENTKEKLIIRVVLADGETYTKAEADKLVKNWKQKEVK